MEKSEIIILTWVCTENTENFIFNMRFYGKVQNYHFNMGFKQKTQKTLF